MIEGAKHTKASGSGADNLRRSRLINCNNSRITKSDDDGGDDGMGRVGILP